MAVVAKMSSNPQFSELKERYNLQELGLNLQVSDRHIQKFSSSHGSKWRLMPAPLNLKTIVAEDIDRAPIKEEEKRHAFFTTWKLIQGSFATYKALITALLEVGSCQEDAESVCSLVPEDAPPALAEAKSTVPAATLSSAVVEKISVSMTPGQLQDWLKSSQMLLADCRITKGTCIELLRSLKRYAYFIFR